MSILSFASERSFSKPAQSMRQVEGMDRANASSAISASLAASGGLGSRFVPRAAWSSDPREREFLSDPGAIDTTVYTHSMAANTRWERAAGNLLVMARQKTDLTQVQLAERAGVPQSAISAYERGVRQPTLPTLFRLLTAAGLDLRLRLADPDHQARAAAEWEASRPLVEQQRWADEQRRASRRSR